MTRSTPGRPDALLEMLDSSAEYLQEWVVRSAKVVDTPVLL
jgi:hypothetical protein